MFRADAETEDVKVKFGYEWVGKCPISDPEWWMKILLTFINGDF